jgi:transcriptional regulator with XRE-family HTH domain
VNNLGHHCKCQRRYAPIYSHRVGTVHSHHRNPHSMENREKSNKDELRRRVRDLRETFGESQEAFARRLGSSVRTVARYETAAPPSGRSLAQFAKLARSEGQAELWAFFEAALAEELYGSEESREDTAERSDEGTLETRHNERRRTKLFLYLLCVGKIVGDPRWTQLRAPLKNLILTLLEEDSLAEIVFLGQILAPVLDQIQRDASMFAQERSGHTDAGSGGAE